LDVTQAVGFSAEFTHSPHLAVLIRATSIVYISRETQTSEIRLAEEKLPLRDPVQRPRHV
jgi:hypothetical protein